MKNCRSTIVKALALAAAAVIVQACDLTLRGPASTRPPIAPFTGSRIQQSEKSAQPNRLSSSDWSSIRQEHLRRQQAAFPVEGGWRARNYQQNWSAFFDGRGFEITPDDGSWRWGLKLTSYGYEGQERRVDTARSAADGEKFSYQWDSILREWYVNGESVEHGYTVAERPGNGAGLRFRLDVLGTLEPRVAPDGRSITFIERGGGARVINYGGLKVTDAAGRQLGARFWKEDSGLRLEIDDADAQYPITVDPMIQLAYLKASNADVADGFGYSVAVDGDFAVVGAPYEDSNGTLPSDNSLSFAGAAYVFWRTPSGVWMEVGYLKAPNPDASDYFGYSVGVGHNSVGDVRVVVGAWGEDGPRDAGAVNPSSNINHDSGAAYVFKLDPTECLIIPRDCPPIFWPLEQYLKGRWLQPDDHFSIVAISGDTIVVGAFNDDDFDEGDPDVGAAYVFTIDSTAIDAVWTQEAYLKPTCFCPGHQFGLSVGVSEDEQTVIVGAWKDSITTLSKAYVFTRAGTAWNWQATLQPPNQTANSYFGFSVGISGDTAVVGAPATAFDNGRAYLFKRSLPGPPPWTLEGTLIPGPNSRAFGWSVAISGDGALVGAPRSSLTGTGNGEWYLFTRPPLGSVWSQQDHFQTANFQDGFGSSVALSGSTVVVGAFEESGNSLSHSGAAYVFGPAVTLTSILIKAPTTMVLGTSEQFTADGTYSDGTHADLTNQVTWKSSTSAVTFSTPGLATGAALGPSDITASMSGIVSNTVALTVTAPVLTGISIEPTSLVGPFASPLYLTLGASEQLRATGHYSDGSSANLTNQVIWHSSTSAVTFLTPVAGLATGTIAGSAEITASMGAVTSNIVPVIVRTFTILISAPSNTMPVGSSEPLTATALYSDNTTANITNQATWNSSTSAVTISATGVASSASGGSSAITASMGGVISNLIDLQVVQAATRTLLSASENSVSRGQPVTFTADVLCSCTVVPHGQVVFKDYGVSLPAGASTLVNGHATLDVTALSIGRHSITATFIENTDFFSSTSGTEDILVVGASGVDESSGTAARAILIGSVSGSPIDPEDTISGSFGGNASAQTDDILNVGYSAAHSSLSPVVTPGGSLSFGPSVGAYTRGDSGPICARSCTRGTGAGRAISYAKYRNDTQSVQTFQVSGIIDGRFSSNSISASGHVTAMVYVFDQDEFLNTIDTSGQSMPQFLLGRDTLDDYATANASTLPLTRLFPSVITTSEFRVLTAGSPNLPLQTGLTSVGPGHAVIVVLDISAFQPPGGIVDYFTTLKPAPVFLTDPAGNPSPMTAVGPWAPATPAAVNLTLTPAATTNPLTTSVTLTATATTGAGAPVPDTTVYWQITSGPNAQQLGPAKTGVNGKASLTYTGGAGAGTDLIQASIESLTSNVAAITWTTPGPLDHISISPASATVAAGATQAYTAAGLDLFDHSTGDVTANTIFSISPDGSCTGATCTASVAGTHRITGTYAGKTATAALEVTGSSSFTFQGFFQPIDMSTSSLVVWNTVKGGQAVPVKWLLTLNGAPVSDAASFAGLSSYPVACSSGAGAIDEAIEESAAGSSGLQYNGSGNWQFNWKTLSSYKNTCRAVVVKFTDGTTSPAVNFKFK